ncbi:MAG: transcription termination/antitermination protein NusA, partial [Exiguobacterium sp.]
IVRWSEDPKEFVRNALSPAQVVAVYVNEPAKSTTVVVPDYQLSLAIGKRGQNARLAAKLTGWKIDIKSETDAEALDLFDTFAEKVESEPEIVQNEVEQDLSDATVETTAVKEEE